MSRARDPRAGLPPVWPRPLAATIRRRGRARTVFVLDDDPTGTQTVRRIPVLIDPSAEELAHTLRRSVPLAFILTNSRSLPADRAVALAQRLGSRIARASKATGRGIELISRSDSTLRGHFPAEVDAIAGAVGLEEAPILLMPYLGDAGRITIGDVHYVVRDDVPVPVAETEYARDPAFAYRESNLRDWAAARLFDQPARPVVSVALDVIRAHGPDAVRAELAALPPRAICVVNAADDRDAEVVAAAVVELERSGRPIVARTAAGYVRARAGQARQPDLRSVDLPVPSGPGLVVVGSHVPMTTRQLQRLINSPPLPLELVEIDAATAGEPRRARRTVEAARTKVGALLEAGVTPVVATSRGLVQPSGSDPTGLQVAEQVSSMLIAAVAEPRVRPAWIVAKGGITSSDVATRALQMKSALVLGQLLPGVPVWRVRPRTSRRGMLLVVFPGNVGDEDALRRAVATLAVASERRRDEGR
jgi:uncharacterized protein YgbK (DUF1537 family)